jgi:hypothetical protein
MQRRNGLFDGEDVPGGHVLGIRSVVRNGREHRERDPRRWPVRCQQGGGSACQARQDRPQDETNNNDHCPRSPVHCRVLLPRAGQRTDSGCWFSRGPRQDQPLGSTPALADMAQSLHEHSCHALVEAWLLPRDGLADESYGREDFPGRDVLARVPARYRPGQERAERRLELVEETLREAIVGGVTGVQRGGETALGGDEFREALGPPQERVPWAQCGPERCGSVDALVDLVLHYGDDEVGPAREMPVQRADAHSRTIGDLLRGRVHAAVCEHGLGGLH